MTDQGTAQAADIAFEAGVAADGTIATQAFENWKNNSPATYNTSRSFLYKWNNDANGNALSATSLAGTSGGTVTYSFSQNVTADQQATFMSTLTLWSDETNISFKQETATGTADLVFTTNVGQGTFSQAPPSNPGTLGSVNIPGVMTPDQPSGGSTLISFDTSGRFGTIGSFTDLSGYGVDALTHEVGHAIGLGHSGPYNDGSSIPAQSNQFNAYDSRQYSVMSYIDPADTSAKYYGQYTVTGTNWQGAAPETPMLDDILAAQRLYGASTSKTFAGGQVFGFNSNIADSSKMFFDFTVNVNPVITLYDTGTNNTLDCSGFSTNCTINLNPGTFSSASYNGMTNNIGIAYGTRIDAAIGGSGNDTFIINANNDTINGGGGFNTAIFSDVKSAYTVAQTGAASDIVTNNKTGAVDVLTNIQSLQFSDTPQCFTTGTLIEVFRGGGVTEVAIEMLRVGDLAVTATGSKRKIRWIGRRSFAPSSHHLAWNQCPVRILAGAFGLDREGGLLPRRDLRLSPGHPVLAGADRANRGGVLVPIMCLVNGTSIAREQVDHITYWHIELEEHDLLMAEGLPAESFLDCGSRSWFEPFMASSQLVDPDFTVPGMGRRCRPVVTGGERIVAERGRLDTLFALSLECHCCWPGKQDGSMDDWSSTDLAS